MTLFRMFTPLLFALVALSRANIALGARPGLGESVSDSASNHEPGWISTDKPIDDRIEPAKRDRQASGGFTRRVTVSGQSAGGSMAIQHLFAFSSVVDGVGIAAGSPYGCGSLHNRNRACYYGGANLADLNEYVKQRASQGLIDDLSHLKSMPVHLFNGKNDWTVYTQAMRDTKRQLLEYVDARHVTASFDTGAAHVWSLDHGHCKCGACIMSGSVECCDVNNCKYDLSGDMLRRFYGSISPPTTAKPNQLYWVNQWNYLPETSDGVAGYTRGGMMQWALVYVPTSCGHDPGSCRVHVNYHGCIKNQWKLRKAWATSIDLNEYGEANGIIVVYPQTAGDKTTGKGCWNWDAYGEDKYFDTREGVQLRTVAAMIEDLERGLQTAVEADSDE